MKISIDSTDIRFGNKSGENPGTRESFLNKEFMEILTFIREEISLKKK
jgi:hypothetical protein